MLPLLLFPAPLHLPHVPHSFLLHGFPSDTGRHPMAISQPWYIKL